MKYILPVLHPAFVMRGQFEQEPVQVLYLKRARQIATQGTWDRVGTEVPRGSILFPRLVDLEDWARGIDDQGVSCDIETAGNHIRTVGFCRLSDFIPLTFHIRRSGGHMYWQSHREMRQAVEWLWGLLAEPSIPKIFHNGQAFDVPMLKDNGFVVEGYRDDTLLMQHIAYAELPKKLEFCGKVYLGAGGWKHLVKDEDEKEGG